MKNLRHNFSNNFEFLQTGFPVPLGFSDQFKNAFVLLRSGIKYPVPPSINYFWNFGSLSLIALIGQIITGIMLAMHYCADINYAFLSVEHIMRDVNNGWLLRYFHANGASFFFLVVYIHILRGLFYGSFIKPRHFVWIIGVIIFFLMVGIAFLGYVLPWGQMSFWAATVITNLASALPLVGKFIVYWLWGGYSVDNATLTRFYSLHYLLPFVLLALVFIHIFLLHEYKSSVPLGFAHSAVYFDKVYLHPYFTIKDFFGFCLYGIFLMYIICFFPNILGHPDNYIPANPLVTPAHIVPEWYFLLFYAILRSVPSKLGGVILLLAAICILVFIPFMYNLIGFKWFNHTYLYIIFFWLFVANSVILAWTGGNPASYPFVELATTGVKFYFIFFFCVLPVFSIYFNLDFLSYSFTNKNYKNK